jgi:hypothetical protein
MTSFCAWEELARTAGAVSRCMPARCTIRLRVDANAMKP